MNSATDGRAFDSARRGLIPRRVLFDNPTFFDAKLSPDGQFVSWLAPVDGVLNLWVAPCDHIAGAEPVTRTKGRPITWQDWSPDGRFLMFIKDENGDENFHLFVVDPWTCALRDLTPYPGVRAMPTLWSRAVPNQIAVTLNDRDPRSPDVFALDLDSGERTLIWQNTQQLEFVGLDWQLKPRHARSYAPDGGARLWRIEDGTLVPWCDVPFEASWSTRVATFDISGRHLHLFSCLHHDKTALVRMDWATGDEQVLFASDEADVTGWILDGQSFEPLAAAIDPGRQHWHAISGAVANDLALIRDALPGHAFHVISQSDDARRWTLMSYTPQQPGTFHLYDRNSGTVTELFTARPELKSYRLAPMHPISAKARDGLDLVSYLTLPSDIDGDRPPEPLPMVLVVHGGPWGRDVHGYRGDHQWLADRGYAVLSVNYRGSTGFGKAFVSASEKQHARKMHDDLIDMVDWAVAQGVALRDRIAITGVSYGGYASFVAATFTPEVFCCAVPVVGITNLQTLLESMPPYWSGFAEFMYRSYGDPRTAAGRALLAERSPIHQVDNITKPMLIFHGANDVRCLIAESDTIVAAMRQRSIPVTYIVYPDEGHGFQKPENRLSYIAMAEAFFARHLGGAFEPIDRDFDGSSHEVRAGAPLLADYIA
ncbi:Dipeptidyl anminopeptidase [Bradyrhizobium sp. STM 3843]|uniref:S9 family peptidase n=1 Tax=Bradyrhizobium sp. STM 3843 TaxID=551947 RepID=UPI0002407740|nr:S9 family peptidase [Bradyrhizobium sp. STM 3843]CCE07264.1 Dipeptidyl anminopeptidase [Bradyrhizobium sp. STM 3843]